MRKLKIFLLASLIIGFFSLIGCTKNNTTTVNHPDSVYTSSWVTLSMTLNTTDSDYEQNLSAPAITSSILNDGVVLGYGAYLNNANDTVVESAIEFDMYQSFTVGNILLQAGFNNTGLWYRYVIVPGHVLTTKGLTPMQARSMSYAELTRLVSTPVKQASTPTVQ